MDDMEHSIRLAGENLAGIRFALERIASALEEQVRGGQQTNPPKKKRAKRQRVRRVVVPDDVEVDEESMAKARAALRRAGLREL